MTLLIAVSALSMGAGTSSIPRSGAADYCETAGKRSGFFRADFLYAGLGLRLGHSAARRRRDRKW